MLLALKSLKTSFLLTITFNQDTSENRILQRILQQSFLNGEVCRLGWNEKMLRREGEKIDDLLTSLTPFRPIQL